MNKIETTFNLDDVLDFYLASSEQAGIDTLTEMIERFPQHKDDLREFAAFRQISAEIPDRQYTEEEEQLLKARAVSIVQNLLYQQERASEKSSEAFSSLLNKIEDQFLETNEFYQQTGLSEQLVMMLDRCQVIYATIARKAIENIASALGISFQSVEAYLQGEMRRYATNYKAEQAPESPQLHDFAWLIEIDDDLTDEQKAYWLATPTIGMKTTSN